MMLQGLAKMAGLSDEAVADFGQKIGLAYNAILETAENMRLQVFTATETDGSVARIEERLDKMDLELNERLHYLESLLQSRGGDEEGEYRGG